MDIRGSLDGLKNLLGVNATASSPGQIQSRGAEGSSALKQDSATLSSAGNEVAVSATDSDIRSDKVAAIQQALASGTYNVPVTEVASRMVDAMLTEQK